MAGHEDIVHYAVNSYEARSDPAFFDYDCARCGHSVHGVVLAKLGYHLWLLCPRCESPAHRYREYWIQPRAKKGPEIKGLPDAVQRAYDEARNALAAGAPTACELLCRKLLMYIAVDVADAQPGKTFAAYIEALADKGYVTPPMEPWVKLIKDRANEATHELPAVTNERAESTLFFTAELLRLSYEMSHLANEFA